MHLSHSALKLDLQSKGEGKGKKRRQKLNTSSEQALCYMLYIKYIFHCIVTESYEVDVIFILKEKKMVRGWKDLGKETQRI